MSIAQSAICRTWQPARCVICFVLYWAVYATAMLKFSTGTNGRCARSTASRYVTIFRATAIVARFVFPFCFAFSYTKASSWLCFGASFAASTRTRWICLLRCLEKRRSQHLVC
jgi:hypothetical protein